jgi:hypothetical protein
LTQVEICAGSCPKWRPTGRSDDEHAIFLRLTDAGDIRRTAARRELENKKMTRAGKNRLISFKYELIPRLCCFKYGRNLLWTAACIVIYKCKSEKGGQYGKEQANICYTPDLNNEYSKYKIRKGIPACQAI